MPRLLPELANEPLDWNVIKIPPVQGKRLTIDKAINVTDLCPAPPPDGTTLILCLFNLPLGSFGQMAAVLRAREVPSELTSGTVDAGVIMAAAEAVAKQEYAGKLMLQMIQQGFGIEPADLAAVVEDHRNQ